MDSVVYEWDEGKNRQNESKHGLSFGDVGLVMSGSCLSFQDLRRGYNEERFITIGFLEGLWW